ncbi:MAG: hypothetical protein ACJA0S_000257 [Rickettsiales bacterium]|jgi:hypothetical protein
MNKSLTTNLVALLLALCGYFSPIHNEAIFMVGIFALSGSLTNMIAIHMLFEKVPLLYGSGVILNRFEDFKTGIKNLIIDEFFNKEHIEKFFKENGGILSAQSIEDKIDFDKVFEDLKDAIVDSPMGSMIAMFGGRDALDPLKDPITQKLRGVINDLAKSENSDGRKKSDLTENIIVKIEQIIDKRLADLTPKMVKDIMVKMIKKHLGWLVVWGGVFGGLIGLVFAIIS